MATFVERVREARARAHLTQMQLAVKSSIALRSIAAYESGEAEPNIESLSKLAGALGCTTDWLLDHHSETVATTEPTREVA
jgi:transcriptional regulator with XRE-family HTH domain